MKKIINGKLYDTDSAVELASFQNGYGPGDFKHLYEALYQKKNGEYFLHGIGGAMTIYAVGTPDGTTGGETIRPLTEAEAKEWSEKSLEADDYIRIWGEPEE